MTEYEIAEKFVSINGEGTKAGELSVFIRFKGCNLNCPYCDTSWANTDNVPTQKMTLEEIIKYADDTGVKNVTLTGGEPMLQKELYKLVEGLMKGNHCVEIETNGSLPLKNFVGRKYRPCFTVDYKLPSSKMEHLMCLENFDCITHSDTVKFVAGDKTDLVRAADIIKKYSLQKKCFVYFSPVFGKIDPAEIVDFMKENELNDIRLQLQLHKYIWDPEKRGV